MYNHVITVDGVNVWERTAGMRTGNNAYIRFVDDHPRSVVVWSVDGEESIRFTPAA